MTLAGSGPVLTEEVLEYDLQFVPLADDGELHGAGPVCRHGSIDITHPSGELVVPLDQLSLVYINLCGRGHSEHVLDPLGVHCQPHEEQDMNPVLEQVNTLVSHLLHGAPDLVRNPRLLCADSVEGD